MEQIENAEVHKKYEQNDPDKNKNKNISVTSDSA